MLNSLAIYFFLPPANLFLQILSKQDDILSNVMWRFLQLRGYVDDKHNLTSWGKCLEQALSAVDPADNLEDAIFIAIEMLRMNLLNTKNWFSHVSGGPMRGSGKSHSHSIWGCHRIRLTWPCRGGQDVQHAGIPCGLYCEVAAQAYRILWPS